MDVSFFEALRGRGDPIQWEPLSRPGSGVHPAGTGGRARGQAGDRAGGPIDRNPDQWTPGAAFGGAPGRFAPREGGPLIRISVNGPPGPVPGLAPGPAPGPRRVDPGSWPGQRLPGVFLTKKHVSLTEKHDF